MVRLVWRDGIYSITVTNKSNFVLGARSFQDTPYNGHTLHSCLEQAVIMSGIRAKEAYVELGYRGVEVPGVTLFKARQKRGVKCAYQTQFEAP